MASKLIRNPTVLTSHIDGEVFMMDIEQSNFLGLNEVASFIWDFLEEARTPDEIIAAVQANFEAPDAEAVTRDVSAFLDTMLKDEMVTRIDG